MTTGYRDLASILRASIQAGAYPPETTLPKQQDIAVTYGVNLGTVRRAIATLEAEGLVTAVRRRGTVVRARPPMKRLGVQRYARHLWKEDGVVAFGADRQVSGRVWSLGDQTQTVRLVPADDEVAAAFGIDPGEDVYERARLVREDAHPTHRLVSFYRSTDVAGTALVDPAPGPAGPGGGFAVLAGQQLEPQEITETFFARMPTPDEILDLALPDGEPVVVLERRTYAAAGRLVEFARGTHAASRFSWTYTFAIPD